VTEVLRVDAETPDPAVVEHAASVLRAGGTVAFPTETVYGVGATALDASAVRRVFEAKGRPPEDPLIVHLAAEDGVHLVARDVLAIAHTLVRRFWPGPLTLVLLRRPEVPAEVTAGLDTVAVRMPAHHVALAMIEAARAPVAAPSANRFGRASPTTAQHVLDDLEGRIDLVLDAGPTSVGLESTVLDLTREVPTILRPGGVAREEIERVVGMVEVSGSTAGPAPSPGMLESHYAVAPELVVVECPDARATPEVLAEMTSLARRYGAAGRGVAIAAASRIWSTSPVSGSTWRIFSTVSPKKYTVVSWLAGGTAPGRAGCLGGWMPANPAALWNTPSRVFVLKSARSAVTWLLPWRKSTLPLATARSSSP